jgi:hypothetical protein
MQCRPGPDQLSRRLARRLQTGVAMRGSYGVIVTVVELDAPPY